MISRHKFWISALFSGLTLLVLASILIACQPPTPIPSLTPTPFPSPLPSPPTTPDRLREPPLPSNPTQLERGRHLYWLNCMPCHGDQGQGLTDEFRSLWVEDHQNCWGRGCHAGRAEDQGFPIPRSIPAVISTTGELPPFASAGELFEYLHTTHPPQHPGILPEDETWAITAYLLAENGRLAEGEVPGPQK